MRLTASLFSKVAEYSKRYSNLPDRYIKRKMEIVYWRTPRGKPQYMPRTVEKKNYYFSIDRPWMNSFRVNNMKNMKPVLVEPIKKWSFFRGDRVEILTGRDKGKQGIVKDIIQERNWIIVEGLNTKLIHIKDKKNKNEIKCVQLEQPLLVTTQVQLVDPGDMKGTPITWRYTEDGECVRVSSRTGRIIPIPVSNDETIDYKLPSLYKEYSKDTPGKDACEVTFDCSLKTFEMDIMDKMGIKEDRVPKKTYWY